MNRFARLRLLADYDDAAAEIRESEDAILASLRHGSRDLTGRKIQRDFIDSTAARIRMQEREIDRAFGVSL